MNTSLGDAKHSYNTSAYRKVLLTAKEMGRENSAVDYIGVVIFKPNNVSIIPVILSPSNSRSNSSSAFFDASKTMVLNCSSGPMANTNFTLYGQNCTFLHYPGSYFNQTLPGYNLTFNWKFDLGKNNDDTKIGEWNLSNYLFTHVYETGGRHDISLSVSYSI